MPTESNKIPCSGLRVALTICSLLYAIYDKNFKFKWVEIPQKIMESEFSWKLTHLPIWTSIPIEFYGTPCSGLRDVLTKKKTGLTDQSKTLCIKIRCVGYFTKSVYLKETMTISNKMNCTNMYNTLISFRTS